MAKHLDTPLAVPPPGPRGYPWIGVLPRMWADPLQFFLETAEIYGDISCLSFGSRSAFLLNHPDMIRYVLQDNNRNYRKSSTVKVVKQVLGKGLATNEGDSWLHQRRLMQPAFHRQKIAQLGELITAEIDSLLTRWQTQTNFVVDIHAEMMRLTLRLVLKTLFSHDVQNNVEELGRAWGEVLHYFNKQSWALIQLPDTLPLPANRRFHRSLQLLNQEVNRMITQRRQTPSDHEDLLGLLLAAQDEESSQGMTDQQLRDEMMTIFLAGHETTANALAWAWYLLAQHPQVVTKLREELTAVLGNRPPTAADLPHLPYNRMVIDEVLRLYPPFWLIYRSPYQPDTIGGYPLPADGMVFICPYVMHRHPRYWERPNSFEPERFTPEQVKERPSFVYIPFGGGPHQCIGNNLALMEAQLVLATIVQQFDICRLPNTAVTPEASVTLRPKGGLRMRLEKIKSVQF